MAEPHSKRFIQALEPLRDRLYSRALDQAESPAAAEVLLQRAVRHALLASFENSPNPDPIAAIDAELRPPSAAAAPIAQAVMPADVWARLTATVQIEAARSGPAATPGGGKTINPDSLLLLPDPLLAPKRPAAQDEALEGLNLSPPSRFLVAAGSAILLGILLTLFIITRHAGSSSATSPATTRGAAPATAAAHHP